MRRAKTKLVRTQGHTLILACVCLIALSGIHCGEGKDPAYSRGSTVTVLSPMEDEWLLSPAASDAAQFLVFLPLVTYGGEGGESRPALAERWENSPDGRT